MSTSVFRGDYHGLWRHELLLGKQGKQWKERQQVLKG